MRQQKKRLTKIEQQKKMRQQRVYETTKGRPRQKKNETQLKDRVQIDRECDMYNMHTRKRTDRGR